MFNKKKKTILLLIDKPGWAFDNCASGFIPYLEDDFNIDIAYVIQKPDLDKKKYDLIHIFFYGEDYYKNFRLNDCKIIKEISSHRWEDTPPYGPRTPREVYNDYLFDSDGIICVSKRLYNHFSDLDKNVFFVPNGVDLELFKPKKILTGPLTFGWAGNPKDPVKGLNDYIIPALNHKVDLSIAENIPHRDMNSFYDKIDVLIIGSKHEGEPIPLLEAMANGCFPITTDVGIANELITNYKNGIILEERSIKSLSKAINWCNQNAEFLRSMQTYNSNEISKSRDWAICSSYLKFAYRRTLS